MAPSPGAISRPRASDESLDALSRKLREQFPALALGEVFFENAGGSQVPACVPEAMRRFMLDAYVQIGTDSPASQKATDVFDRAHAFANLLMNGDSKGRTVVQPSTSQAFKHLADAYGEILKPGDRVVIAETGHEANIGPWVRLERLGIAVDWWKVNPETCRCELPELERLLGPQTRIVAYPHVSNLLGEVVDVCAITKLCHDAGAKVAVDGVAYAPHLAVDVDAWDVDWYAFSMYKVYGPHVALLYGKHEAFAELTGPNHFFIPEDYLPHKFQLGCPSYEGMAGLLAVGEYLSAATATSRPLRETIEAAYDAFFKLEQRATARFVEFLLCKPKVRIIGPPHAGAGRVGTISFVHSKLSPPDIVALGDKAKIGYRCGHMYAYRLCQALGIEPETGVVRVSFVHYNTVEEVEKLIEVLEPAL